MSYNGYNFSGNLLMSGESQVPGCSSTTGCAVALREALVKWGISAERNGPRAVWHPSYQEAAADFQKGEWNLQADANLSNFMDFSDYYVLPDSRLPKMWRMSEEAFKSAYVLSSTLLSDQVLQSNPALSLRVFGTTDKEAAKENCAAQLVELSKNEKIVEGSRSVDNNGVIVQGNPKYCMCWWMELDDSEMTSWAMQRSSLEEGESIGDKINANLPVSNEETAAAPKVEKEEAAASEAALKQGEGEGECEAASEAIHSVSWTHMAVAAAACAVGGIFLYKRMKQ